MLLVELEDVYQEPLPSLQKNVESMVQEQALWLTSKCKNSFQNYRDNPILTIAENVVDAKKDFERKCNMAKNTHVKKTEKLLLGLQKTISLEGSQSHKVSGGDFSSNINRIGKSFHNKTP